MKKPTLIFAFCFLLSVLVAPALTPFVQYFYNQDGTPQTNAITVIAYPAQNTWVVVGSNLYYGGAAITLQPGTNGYLSNAISAGGYRLTFANTDVPLYVNILNTTNVLPLTTYATNVPVIAGDYLTSHGIITNMLGYDPLASNALAVKGALTYTPATNSPAGISNAMGFGAATNTPTGIAGALGFAPATNTSAGILAALTFVPATNSPAGISNALGYVPAQQGGSILESQLPQIGHIGVTNLNGAMITNRATGQIILWTNIAAGVTPTITLPNGSLIMGTNGGYWGFTNGSIVNLK